MALSHEKRGSDKEVLPESLIHTLEEIWVETRQAVTLTAMVLVVLRGVRRLGVLVLEHVLEERDWELGLREGEHHWHAGMTLIVIGETAAVQRLRQSRLFASTPGA